MIGLTIEFGAIIAYCYITSDLKYHNSLLMRNTYMHVTLISIDYYIKLIISLDASIYNNSKHIAFTENMCIANIGLTPM